MDDISIVRRTPDRTWRFAGMTFEFEAVEHRIFRLLTVTPVCLLEDGTELHAIQESGRTFLVVDHRRDRSQLARVERWRPTFCGEVEIGGVYALCDAESQP